MGQMCHTWIKVYVTKKTHQVHIHECCCCATLQAYSWCLDMHRIARAKDALVILRRKLETRPRGQVDDKNKPAIEAWLEKKYKGTKVQRHKFTSLRSRLKTGGLDS